MVAIDLQKAEEDSRNKKTSMTLESLLCFKLSWLSFPALEMNKSFLIVIKEKSFCCI